MLSGQCRGCSEMRRCAKRFVNVRKGEFVYCPDGSRCLVDEDFELVAKC